MSEDLRWYRLVSKKHDLDVAAAFRLLRDNGIEPILIKGRAAAANYPDGHPRYPGDIDLGVSSSEFDRAKMLVSSSSAHSLPIDLHCELRHLDTLPWHNLFADSVVFELESTQVRVLCPEDHLRVLATHWLNDGGAYKERLWDIYYAVKNRPNSFDWGRCLDVVSPRRRKWVIAAIGLAHRYLELEIEDLPFADQASTLPGWLMRAVEKEWRSGTRIIPLNSCLSDPKVLWQQIWKRIPPNPVQATIETEGEFDEGSRIPYQIRDIFLRLGPSAHRLSKGLSRR
jgi:hypothetical protein